MFNLLIEFFKFIWHTVFPSPSPSLKNILSEHGVPSTAALTNYWKDFARLHKNFSAVTISQGQRASDLYKDPYLSLFYNEHTAIEARNRLDIRMWLPLATRTKYFRKTLSTLIKTDGVQQVVILGAGFDTLAVRKQKYSEVYGVVFYEIDHKKILSCKESIFKAHGINKNAKYIGMDYTQEDFIASLLISGLNKNLPTFFLWEGNTFYLQKEMVLTILKRLSETFPKLIISFDFMHPQIEQEKKTIDNFAKKESPFQTFFTEAEIDKECQQLSLSTLSHFTTDILATKFELDETPYHTAKPYSVITKHSGFLVS